MQSSLHPFDGPVEDHIYLRMGDICIYLDAVRVMQCPRDFPTLNDGHFPGFSGTLFGGVH